MHVSNFSPKSQLLLEFTKVCWALAMVLQLLPRGTLQGIQYGSSTGSFGRKSGRIVNLQIRQKIQVASTVNPTRIQIVLEAQYIWAPEASVAIKS